VPASSVGRAIYRDEVPEEMQKLHRQAAQHFGVGVNRQRRGRPEARRGILPHWALLRGGVRGTAKGIEALASPVLYERYDFAMGKTKAVDVRQVPLPRGIR